MVTVTKQVEAFSIEEVRDVLDLVSGSTQTTVKEQIVKMVENGLPNLLSGIINISGLSQAGTRQVMLRVRTLQSILDEFRRILGERYDPVLRDIGRNIGFNFAISLLRTLRQVRHAPLDFDTLLQFWAEFDSAAQLGHFSFAPQRAMRDKLDVAVDIKDLFLTLGYGDDNPLRHCPMMNGYLEAAMDNASLLWSRWIVDLKKYRVPGNYWSVSKCESRGQDSNGITRFAISLEEEKWRSLKDKLCSAVNAAESGNLTGAIVDGRSGLEMALALLAGEDSTSRISFGKLLVRFSNARVAGLNYDRWRESYNECSDTAHGRKTYNEISTINVLMKVWCCIKEAELTRIPEESLSVIRADMSWLIPRPAA